MLRHAHLLSVSVAREAFVDEYDFLEVQFLEVDVHPAH